MQVKSGYWIAIGLVLGGLVGVVMKNIPIGGLAGLAIGAGIAAYQSRKQT
jgi:hypothetical protein